MAWNTQDYGGRFNRDVLDVVEEIGFRDLWPSETAGDGKIIGNSLRTGGGQGKASMLRKAKCQQCGFPVDLAANDHSGGAESTTTGAGGAITTATYTSTYANGTTHVEKAGTQVYNKGAGCPLCFSKNSTDIRVDVSTLDPWNRLPPLGF